MQGKYSTNIYYHIPQDRDSPEHPNYFTIPLPRGSLKLEHIYNFFPLRGTYIFRFKFAFEGVVVWLDLNDFSASLPTFKESIVVKANRISWDDSKPNFAKKQKQTQKISELKQVKKQSSDLFDSHDNSHKYVSTQSAKNSHEDILGTTVSSKRQSGGQPQSNLLEGFNNFHGQVQSSNPMNFFEVKQVKSTKGIKQSVDLMGNFEKHGDLI